MDKIKIKNLTEDRTIVLMGLFLKLNENDKIKQPYIVAFEENTQAIFSIILLETLFTDQITCVLNG